MKNLLVLIVLGSLVWYGYGKYKSSSTAATATETATPAKAPVALDFAAATPAPAQFSCDGRTHCSQMRSCAEATYFIQQCPDTKMDGNNDGVPCESQWCN